MKKNLRFIPVFPALIMFLFINFNTKAQSVFIPVKKAFHKGCLLVSISEGSTTASYSTKSTGSTGLPGNTELPTSIEPKMRTATMDGLRDPLFIEFGLSNRFGIGLSTGNDIFKVNSMDYYGFKLPSGKQIEAKTSEFTLDLNYHIYTGIKTDISLYTSVGSFGVAFSGKEGDFNYKYNAKGGIIRFGTKARYYFCKRIGVLGMVSYYSGNASTKDVAGNTVANNVSTSIKGYALEFGLCCRLF